MIHGFRVKDDLSAVTVFRLHPPLPLTRYTVGKPHFKSWDIVVRVSQ